MKPRLKPVQKNGVKRPKKIKTENSRAGALKKLFIALLVFAQLMLLIYLHLSFVTASAWLFGANILMSLLTSIYVLSTNKNGLSKAVWIMFLLVCFPFSSLIYWLSDERAFFYKARKSYRAVFDATERYGVQNELLSIENDTVKNDCRYLYSVGRFNAYSNSSVKYFPSGELFFDDVIEELQKASKFIFIEFFILADGILFDRIFEILKNKVKDGVDVRVIYDDLGSKGTLSIRAKKKLNRAGIKVFVFNKIFPFSLAKMNYRDHRKIISIDGKVAYTGGCNLADEYANCKKMNGYWKDACVKVNGNAVDGFTLFFLRQWEFCSKKKEDYSVFLNLFTPVDSDCAVIPYADGLDYLQAVGRGVYERIISGAKDFLYIMTPYFVIDDGLSELLINQALSGVDVRIILPDIPDKTYVYSVSRNNAEKLVDYGVKVYTLSGAFVHSKVVMSENCASVGSVNMDLRSFYQQFECGVYSNDSDFLAQVKSDFDDCFVKGKLITEKDRHRNNIFNRIKAGAMQVFAPFM